MLSVFSITSNVAQNEIAEKNARFDIPDEYASRELDEDNLIDKYLQKDQSKSGDVEFTDRNAFLFGSDMKSSASSKIVMPMALSDASLLSLSQVKTPLKTPLWSISEGTNKPPAVFTVMKVQTIAEGKRCRCSRPSCTLSVWQHELCFQHSVEKNYGAATSRKSKTGGPLRSKQHKDGIKTVNQNGNRKCKVEGCLMIGHFKGYCFNHGRERGLAKTRSCKMDGCEKKARLEGYCAKHGGRRRCKYPECSKLSYNKGLCCGHGGRPICKVVGCEKSALHGGAVKGHCFKHGGGKRCKHSDCNKHVQAKDLCRAHGGWYPCDVKGCSKS